MSDIKFCNKCDNMVYIKISSADENKLEYYCSYCKNSISELTTGVCVLKTDYTSKKNVTYSINEYTKHDYRLAYLKNIPCPNEQCKSNTSKDENIKPEIKYIRYNDSDLKYVYICCHCDFVWETNNKT
jgi:DNA-directed RNA polymerase subunit M/transcription elongation factor TFIIS